MRGPELTGRLIAGRYEVLAWIGEGGFASVWRARQLSPECEVAIKVLHPEHSQDPKLVASFLREAKLYVPFRDEPNIATILECGHDAENGVHFLVMTLLGQTVGALIEESGPLPLDRVLQIGEDIGRALETVHAAGLVHRDVKCSNIMTASAAGRERFVLTDFGIGLLQEVADKTITTRELDRVGTWAYAAPEQIRARQRDEIRPSADFYSLGVVLFRAATGQYPFPPHFPQVIQHHLETPPPDPRRLRPDLPASFAEFVLRALAKEPEKRSSSGGEWQRGIARVKAELARPPALPIKRRPWAWALLPILALLLVAGAFATWKAVFAGTTVEVVTTPLAAHVRVAEARGGSSVVVAQGAAPLRFRRQSGRAYEIEADQPGYFKATLSLGSKDAASRQQAVTLEPSFSLAVSSDPQGARLTLTRLDAPRGEPIESYTNCQLAGLHAGRHELSLQMQGRRKLSEEIVIGPELKEIHRTLDFVGGVDLEIYTQPAGARVRLDGGLVNEPTPCRVTDLPSGTHRLYLERDGYTSIDTSVTLAPSRDAQAFRVRLHAIATRGGDRGDAGDEVVNRTDAPGTEISLSLAPMTFAYIHVDGNTTAVNASGKAGPWKVRLKPGPHTFRVVDVTRPVPIDVELKYSLSGSRPPRALVLDWQREKVVVP